MRIRPQRLPAQEGPIIPCIVDTFKEWEEQAVPSYQAEFGSVGGSSNQQSVYDMLGSKIFMETHFPWSPFKEVTTRIVAADFTIKSCSDTMKLAEKHGGKWEEGYYMDDGFGWPVFYGEEGAEQCFNFLIERKRVKL